jgi:hypothetical protein
MRTAGRLLMLAAGALGLCFSGWLVVSASRLHPLGAGTTGAPDAQLIDVGAALPVLFTVLVACVAMLLLFTLGSWLFWCSNPWDRRLQEAAARTDE